MNAIIGVRICAQQCVRLTNRSKNVFTTVEPTTATAAAMKNNGRHTFDMSRDLGPIKTSFSGPGENLKINRTCP